MLQYRCISLGSSLISNLTTVAFAPAEPDDTVERVILLQRPRPIGLTVGATLVCCSQSRTRIASRQSASPSWATRRRHWLVPSRIDRHPVSTLIVSPSSMTWPRPTHCPSNPGDAPDAGSAEVPRLVRVDRRGDVEHGGPCRQRKWITTVSHVHADQTPSVARLRFETPQTGIVQHQVVTSR